MLAALLLALSPPAAAGAPPLMSDAALTPVWTPAVAVPSVRSAQDAWCVALVEVDASGAVHPRDLSRCPSDAVGAVGPALRAWRYAPLQIQHPAEAVQAWVGVPLEPVEPPSGGGSGAGWTPSGWSPVLGPAAGPFAVALPVAPAAPDGDPGDRVQWTAQDSASGVQFKITWTTRDTPIPLGGHDAVLEEHLAKMARLSTRSSLTQGALRPTRAGGIAGRERIFNRGAEVHIGRVYAGSDDVFEVEARFMDRPAAWDAALQVMASFHVADDATSPGPVAPRLRLADVATIAAPAPAALEGRDKAVSCEIWVTVGADGVPTDTRPETCKGAYLHPARDAVMAWRFEPVVLGDGPTRAEVLVPLTFPAG